MWVFGGGGIHAFWGNCKKDNKIVFLFCFFLKKSIFWKESCHERDTVIHQTVLISGSPIHRDMTFSKSSNSFHISIGEESP